MDEVDMLARRLCEGEFTAAVPLLDELEDRGDPRWVPLCREVGKLLRIRAATLAETPEEYWNTVEPAQRRAGRRLLRVAQDLFWREWRGADALVSLAAAEASEMIDEALAQEA